METVEFSGEKQTCGVLHAPIAQEGFVFGLMLCCYNLKVLNS